MRINSIRLSWFRGAGAKAELAVKGKSIVVYGANGAGKSSFVDALEYMLCDGKIGHLSHEYSGKRQEKGVLNTHKPSLDPTTIAIEFADGKVAEAKIQTNGTFALTGPGVEHLSRLDYRRTVLRQDEVAAFISSPKGEKYSALLPLLGLEQLEAAAEGVRQLAKKVERSGALGAKQQALKDLERRADERYSTRNELEDKVEALHEKYRPGALREGGLENDCIALQRVITNRLEALGTDIHLFESLRRIGEARLEEDVAAFQAAQAMFAKKSVGHLKERLEVLARMDSLLSQAKGSVDVCPACGRSITPKDLESHVKGEMASLKSERQLLESFKASIEALKRAIGAIHNGIISPAAKMWYEARQDAVPEAISRLQALTKLPGEQIGEADQIKAISEIIVPIVQVCRGASKEAPPDNRTLLEDFRATEAGEAFLEIGPLLREIYGVKRAMAHLEAVEGKLRESIREQADAAITEISTDIQRMWGILHPGHEIEDVRLRHPDESDKAIDIELKFFGVDLKSPRLTLSEGNRNSLGLCVFLSMALRAESDQPVILDDVVVSLDREHRGMIVELLEREFPARQIVLLTHDRDWFAELRQLLDKGWQPKILRPYQGPQQGIAWSERETGVDDARAQVATSPDGAVNTMRKIMDTELAMIADKLKVPMEYRQGLKNDHRMAHDFLEAFGRSAGTAYQRRTDKGEYKVDANLGGLLKEADKLLVAWGNKGSHTFDVVVAEATKLIDKCEDVLRAFTCPDCEKSIGKLDDGGAEAKQCSCGTLRWRYGKTK